MMNTEQKNYGKKIKISNEYIERERMKNFRKIIPYTSDIAAASVEKREYLRNTIFFDTSGRDGMQMYRAFVNNSITRKKSKNLLIEEIMRFGIPVIELGYPASSEEEFRTILELVELREKLKIPVRFVGLAGTVKEHIKAVKDANLDEVHIFSSGSEAHCWVKFNATPEQMLPVVYDSIKYAIDIGFKKILFSFEDSFSSDPDFLLKVGLKLYEISRENNIEIRYNIPDTIGIADVVHAYGLIRFLSSNLPLRLDVHFHNDTLNAVQNSIFAVFAGASRIQGTFLGIGERTGNASINDILVQMYLKYGIIPYSVYGEEYDLSKLKATCETLSKIIGIEIPFNHPGIGEYAFAHASGIHANAMLKCMRNGMDYSVYALKDPTTLGNTEKIVLGPTAGKSNHIIYLNALGIEVNEDELNKITLSDKTKSYHKHISDAEYILNVYEIINSKKAEYISVDLSSVKLYVSENEKYMTFDYKNEHGKKSAVFYLNNGASINSLELLNNFMDYFMKNNKFLKIKTFKLNFEADNEEFSSSFFKPKVMLDVTYDITLTSKEDTNKGYSTIKLESSVSESSEVDAVIKTFEQIYNSYHALQELRSRTIN